MRGSTNVLWPLYVIIAVLLYCMIGSQYGFYRATHQDRDAKQANDDSPPIIPATPTVTPSATARVSALDEAYVIRSVVLRNQDREVIYRGDVDPRPTIERIAAGRELRFTNDGSTFQNREGRLPKNSSGYYREWVVPTPGEPGPGPQRVVTGSAREAWYTSDHYGSFRRLPNLPTDPKRAYER